MQSDAATSHAAVTAAATRARLLILLGAFISFLLSIGLWFTGSHEQGLFVGLWVPSILSLGALMLPANR
ncbi:MAG: hypothetical protein ABIP94_09830 [Planctomycetota bacterium]